jgi:uncharacterized membrane protein
MRKSVAVAILVLIFAIVLGGRLFFALQTDDFSYSAYYDLRQIEHIKETGKPLYQDELSYGGRTHIFSPFFYYFLSLFTLFMPVTLVAKIIPNLLASLTVFIIYVITYELTQKEWPSLISAFFSGFLLVFFAKTINAISPHTLVLPLIFLFAYCFLKMDKPNYLYISLILILLLVLTHIVVFILILALLIYFLIAKLENFQPSPKGLELLLFLTFLVFWFDFILYKKAFLVHGGSVIWQNTPIQILSSYFTNITVLQTVYAIGLVPLIFGVFAVYHNFFEKKQRSTHLFIGFALASFLLLWFKLITLDLGLMFLGLVLAILAGIGMKLMADYFNKTRFPKAGPTLVVVLLVLFVFTSVLPLLSAVTVEMKDRPDYAEKEALLWLRNNTPNDAVVLATLKEGYAVNYFANRKNVIDSNFLMIPLIEQRYDDVNLIFTTPFKTDAVRKLNEYGVTHIFFSPLARQQYNITKIAYIDDPECFTLLYNGEVQIYSVQCRIS